MKDDKFKPGTGSLHRISYVANGEKPVPLITAQPEAVTAATGRQATFRVEAKGQSPLRFQWYRNRQPVAGADGPTLTVNVTPADDGAEFRCIVSNAYWDRRRAARATLWTTPLPKLLDVAPRRPESRATCHRCSRRLASFNLSRTSRPRQASCPTT